MPAFPLRSNFRLDILRGNGGLTIVLEGDFDGSAAWEGVNTILNQATKSGPVDIDTRGLRRIAPFGATLLRNLLAVEIPFHERVRIDGAPLHEAMRADHPLLAPHPAAAGRIGGRVGSRASNARAA